MLSSLWWKRGTRGKVHEAKTRLHAKHCRASTCGLGRCIRKDGRFVKQSAFDGADRDLLLVFVAPACQHAGSRRDMTLSSLVSREIGTAKSTATVYSPKICQHKSIVEPRTPSAYLATYFTLLGCLTTFRSSSSPLSPSHQGSCAADRGC